MTSRLHRLLATLGTPRVLVVGDIILDEYLRGTVKRISPEAPVPVLASAASEQALGGAANVANNLAALGCQSTLCGVVGDDTPASVLQALLSRRGIRATAVVTVPGRPTTHKLRVVAQGHHMLRIDRETGDPVGGASQQQLVAAMVRAMDDVDGIICSDYQKGVLHEDVLRTLFAEARTRGLRVVVDPKGTEYGRYRGAHVITPNTHELELAAGVTIRSEADRDRAAVRILEQTEADYLLVTCGKDGMVLYGRGVAGGFGTSQGRSRIVETSLGSRLEVSAVHIPAQAREVYDVTGAGDTVIAMLALASLSGAPMEEAARLANAAAGLVVGKLGTATVTRNELADYLDGHELLPNEKVLPLGTLCDLLARARARGQRVVFTNGCFDILHAGHVQYLQGARALGDLLVVAVNTDRSIRDLKGPKRPIVPETERAQLLAALGCVDYVVMFDEPTPLAVITAVVPEVLVKGADYQKSEVVGREVVERAGGRVELMPLSAGLSTSRLIDAIVMRYGSEPDAQGGET